MPALRLDLEWRMTALTAVLLPLLVVLGFWQLARAEEKRDLAEAFAARQALPPASLASLGAEGLEPYLPVVAAGEFVPGVRLLLDNRISEGRFGYEVVELLRLDAPGPGGAEAVLVNRGWVAGDAARRSLPAVPALAGSQRLQGTLYRAPGDPYLLGEQSLQGDWPLVLQALELDRLAPMLRERTGLQLLPYSLRLAQAQPAALEADWPVVNVSPAKHRGYAVQWFTMAAALVVFFVFRSSNLWALLRGKTSGDD